MGIIRKLTIMSSAAYLDRAQDWAKTLEQREASRSGDPLRDARPRVASRIGVSPGTLENLRNGRLKSIAAHIYDRLRGAVVKELEHEIVHLEHELSLLRQTGADPRDGEIAAVVASLAKVKASLGFGS